MRRKIDGYSQNFVPIQTFREQYDLPASFSVAAFEPKDWQVGSMVGAGSTLLAVKQAVLTAVPTACGWEELPHAIRHLSATFRRELEVANQQIGLQQVEVEFAVAGFEDILQTVGFELLRLHQTHRRSSADPCRQINFPEVYQRWLDDSVRVSGTEHLYRHGPVTLTVRVIYDAYGRIGLDVRLGNKHYYLADTTLACPAASYMRDLCAAVVSALCDSLSGS